VTWRLGELECVLSQAPQGATAMTTIDSVAVNEPAELLAVTVGQLKLPGGGRCPEDPPPHDARSAEYKTVTARLADGRRLMLKNAIERRISNPRSHYPAIAIFCREANY
jgi:hypothetical protein